MKADYKNWLPKGMIFGTSCGFIASLVIYLVVKFLPLGASDKTKRIISTIFFIITIVLFPVIIWMILLYRAFSYDGKRKMSAQIIDGIAKHVDIPDGGIGLDVGCGSGALTIACAKRNPNAKMLGLDRWGKEYASFSKELCESNARAEQVTNTTFQKGNARKLPFSDETFDAVTSNYVYHNIPSRDRQAVLLETLRTLKKGGTFAIHDIMSKTRYGDMEEFADKLRSMGYEKVELIDTTKGMFMTPFESIWMELFGSKILLGKK